MIGYFYSLVEVLTVETLVIATIGMVGISSSFYTVNYVINLIKEKDNLEEQMFTLQETIDNLEAKIVKLENNNYCNKELDVVFDHIEIDLLNDDINLSGIDSIMV